MVRTATLAIALGVLLTFAPFAVPSASAEPLPADFFGRGHGDVIDLDLDLGGEPVSASIGHARAAADSTARPRAEAGGATLEAGAVGIRPDPQRAGAQAGPVAGRDSYRRGLGDLDQSGLLETGMIAASGRTAWAGDVACVPSGEPIATATTSISSATLGGIELGDLELDLLEVGTTSVTTSTRLIDGDVVSTTSGRLPDADLINGQVEVRVVEQPELTARSDGSAGGSRVNDFAVAVTVSGRPTVTLHAGDSLPIRITLDGQARTDLVIRAGELDDTSFGPTGSGTLNFLRLQGTVDALPRNGGDRLAAIDLGLLPLNVVAAGAVGAVECDTIAPPVITDPATGDQTDESPVIHGTGIPGARVRVTDGDTVIGNEPVNEEGRWSLSRDQLIEIGEHRLSAVQTLGVATSLPSNAVIFTVLDTWAPDLPTITRPFNESGTSLSTPTIAGWSEPGSVVYITGRDGRVLGKAPVDAQYNWSMTSAPLEEGIHILGGYAVDDAGNRSQGVAEPVELWVFGDPPGDPTITVPGDGALVNDPRPTIGGSVDGGQGRIEVTLNGGVIGRTLPDSEGNWTARPSAPLTTGGYTLSAMTTNGYADELFSVASDVTRSTFFVDLVAPATPMIEEPADGSTTADGTPTIAGVGEPGATIRVTDADGRELGSVIVDADGHWSVESAALADGEHEITAVAADRAGNATRSNPIIITVGSAAEEAAGESDDQPADRRQTRSAPEAPVISVPAQNGISATDPVTVIGSAAAGSIIEISIDDEVVGSTQANDDGAWSLLPSERLGDGEHTVSATAADPDGNDSPRSDPVTFTIDNSAPGAPVITGPTDLQTESTPVITGRGEPGASLTLFVERSKINTTVDDNGDWTVRIPADAHLRNGQTPIRAEQTDAAGHRSGPSEQFVLAVDTLAAAPTIERPSSGTPTDDTTPAVSGLGEAGAVVTVTTEDGATLGTTEVDDDGNWTIESTELDEGSHTITATLVDRAGNRSPASEPVTMIIDTTEPEAPSITSPNDGSAVDDRRPMIIGTAEPGAVLTVTVDGEVAGTPMAGADGRWAIVVADELAEGSHTATARQTDRAGNGSTRSESVRFIIDSTAPDAPTITGTGDATPRDRGDRTARRAAGPMITGTAEPGAVVTVVDRAGDVIGAAPVDDDAAWEVSMPDLIGRVITVRAIQTDSAGNESPASAAVAVEAPGPGAPPPTTNPPPGDPGDGGNPDGDGTGQGSAADEASRGDVGRSADGGSGADDLAGTGTPGGVLAIALIGLLALAWGVMLLRVRRGSGLPPAGPDGQ